MAVLYNRIDDELSEELKTVAEIAQLSVAALVETLLTERLTGERPPRLLAAEAALNQYREEKGLPPIGETPGYAKIPF